MQMLDDMGERVEQQFDNVEQTVGRNAVGSMALGVLLALGVIMGCTSVFIFVFFILVRFFA